MKILYVAYPLLPVSDASPGGAEQILWLLEREMVRRGHEAVVAACAGSRVSGRLFATGEPQTGLDTFEQRNDEHSRAIHQLLHSEHFDLVHDHSGSFFASPDAGSSPLLGTLHLPRTFYPAVDFGRLRAQVVLNCVSMAQYATFADVTAVAGVVPNGIALDQFAFREQKQDYLLWLGRFCEEKGPHLAIDAARRAKRRLVLAGQVYPFSYHQQYFDREITPRLAQDVQLVVSPDRMRKADLLAGAAALLVPALAEETSSLVALEASASGTPVIAFRRGALADIVQDGETGFLVDDVEGMANAISRIGCIQPARCRAVVESQYSSPRMADDYETLYRRLLIPSDAGVCMGSGAEGA